MIEAQRRASLLTRIGWRVEATAWDAYAAWYKIKGIDRASDAAGDLLRRIGPLTPTQRIARINMQRCFPEAAEPEIDRLLGGMWENFGRLAGEMPHLGVFAGPEFEERVEFIGRERLEAARDAGQPLVLIGMHNANWEIAAAAISQTGLPCHITYRPANNVLIDKRISNMRVGYGVKTLTAKGGEGAKQIMQALKASGATWTSGKWLAGIGVIDIIVVRIPKSTDCDSHVMFILSSPVSARTKNSKQFCDDRLLRLGS